MSRISALWLLLLCGCSTAPCADFLDFFFPGKIQQEKAAPIGGVCLPQGAAQQGSLPSVPTIAVPGIPPPAPPPGAGGVPPPVPPPAPPTPPP